MPQIPGVPNIDPVNQPYMSPSEAARPGETLARTGEEFSELAYGLAGYFRKAQEHVDKLTAENQLNAAYLAMQDDLAKVTNSRDVEGVLQQSTDTVGHIIGDWAKSPAAIDIQETAERFFPYMQHQAQVRQADLLGKENDVSLGNLAKGLLNEVTDSATSTAALAKYGQAVDGSVDTMLMPGWRAQLLKDAFRKSEQVALLDRAASSPNPVNNKAALDELIQHPERYPDLDPHEQAAYKEKLEVAFRTNTDFMQRVGEKQLVDRELPNLRKMYSRADGSFDLQGAIAELDRREALPASDPNHIGATEGGDALREHLRADDAVRKEIEHDQDVRDLNQYSPEVDEHKLSLSQIWGLRDQKKISQGVAASLEKVLQANQRYEESRRQAARAEARAEHEEKLWEMQANSRATALDYYQRLGNGEPVDLSELYSKAGTGQGQILPTDIRGVISARAKAMSDPNARESLHLVNAFPPLLIKPGDSDAVMQQKNQRRMELNAIVQKSIELKGLKGYDIVKETDDILDAAGQQEIGEYLNNTLRALGLPTENEQLAFHPSGTIHIPSQLPSARSGQPAPAAETRTYQGYEYTRGDDGQWHRGRKVE